MAHKEKFNRGQIGHMLAHYDRSKELPEHVDPERKALNYNLAVADQPIGQLEKIHQRLAQVPHRERKDLIVMIDWIVTAPKELPPERHREFFEATYAFLRDRYGAANVVSAWVHNDEVTPHIHFAFVPVTKDNRVCAKDVITRGELKLFHEELQQHVELALGCEVKILNEATKEGNKAIAEMKRLDAPRKLKELEEKIEETERVKGALEALNGEYEAKKAFIDAADKTSEVSMMYPSYVKKIKKGFGKNRQEFILSPKKEWEAKHISANEKAALKAERDALEARIQSFTQMTAADRLIALEDTVKELRRDLQTLEIENSRLQVDNEEIYRKINRVLSKLPAREAKAFADEWNRDGKQDLNHDDR